MPTELNAASTASTPRPLRILAWLNLVGNIVIIGTGGAVRLTSSGLGCPTWPTCASDSWVPTAELTGHSLIEFGNRLMSPVLGLLALALVIVAWRARQTPRRTKVLSTIILGGILAQAVVGGVTVLTGLNAWIVGFHFVVSAGLVGVATALVYFLGVPHGERVRAVPRWIAGLTHGMTGALAVVVILGVFTTGSGPHSGDDSVIRDAALWQVFVTAHSLAAYVMLASTLAITLFAYRRQAPRHFRSAVSALLATQLIQVGVGIAQARLGIPAGLVAVHMVLAGILVAVGTWTLLATKQSSLP